MLYGWRLTEAERLTVIGAELPQQQRLTRTRLLRDIVGSLYLMFPEHPDVRYEWLRRAHQDLNGNSPLQAMLEREDGIRDVAALIREHLR